MSDQITILLEKALQTDHEHEARACFDKAKKLYRGNGDVNIPRRVRRPDDMIAPTDKAAQSAREADRRSLEERCARLLNENQELVSDNDWLRKKLHNLHLDYDEAYAKQLRGSYCAKTNRIYAICGAITFLLVAFALSV